MGKRLTLLDTGPIEKKGDLVLFKTRRYIFFLNTKKNSILLGNHPQKLLFKSMQATFTNK